MCQLGHIFSQHGSCACCLVYLHMWQISLISHLISTVLLGFKVDFGQTGPFRIPKFLSILKKLHNGKTKRQRRLTNTTNI